jgi:RNA polymerase sigma-70 factor, ECF subfamily
MLALNVMPPEPPRVDEIDRGVLDRARAREPIAMRAFVVRYQRQVFGLLSRILGAGPHVEDLAQETFLRAFRALPSFDPSGPARVSTWLLTIATRLALDVSRRRPVAQAPFDEAGAAPDHRTPETEHARGEIRSAIERAAAELSEEQRAAFVLADVHGWSMAEIAEALAIPENTAKTRIHRARQHMRLRLAAFRTEEET